VDDWTPDPRLLDFVQRGAVPRLVNTGLPPHQAIANLRPWLLNQWLSHR
jgi:hypothetical protein